MRTTPSNTHIIKNNTLTIILINNAKGKIASAIHNGIKSSNKNVIASIVSLQEEI